MIDLLFPYPKGGAAIIPGGFGTGKTVIQQSLPVGQMLMWWYMSAVVSAVMRWQKF